VPSGDSTLLSAVIDRRYSGNGGFEGIHEKLLERLRGPL
jgi:hypothetical protein